MFVVMLDMMLGRFGRVMRSVHAMAGGRVGMMRCRLVIVTFIVFGGFAMMFRGFLVMIGGAVVMGTGGVFMRHCFFPYWPEPLVALIVT
jgi:hypothetical protein